MEKVGKIFRTALLNNVKEKVESSDNIFLVSYSGLSSMKMDSFRKDLRRLGAKVYVSKNRIAQIALQNLKQDKLAENVKGQTAFIWSNADSVTISKSLIKFVEACEGMKIQGGLLGGNILSKEDVKCLSELPSREALIAQLLQLILSPLTRFAGALNAKSQDLLSILKQLSEKKGGS